MATTSDGALVEAARAGDSQAFGRLFDGWFDRVHDLSRRIVHDQGIAAEVAQDAFLSAWTRLPTLEDPDAFGGWLLRIARNASLNRLAKERRSVALDDETMTTITDLDAADPDPLAAMDQAARIELVWDAAAALGPRDASVLDLHLRHGLGPAELAEELGTTTNNAHQILFTLRKRLATNVRAIVLWRAGRPRCDDLRTTLADSGATAFDKRTVKLIDRHAEVCAECSDERTERLSPAALFAAAPVVAAPLLLKAQAASALEGAGVPMAGSQALGATGSIGGAQGNVGEGAGSKASGGDAQALAPADHGPVEDGPADDGPADDGPADDGPVEDGPVEDGLADDRALASRRSRHRWLAIAAVVVMLGAIAALVIGNQAGDGPAEEVAAGAATTGSSSDGPVPDGSAADAERESTRSPSTTAPGSFTVEGEPGHGSQDGAPADGDPGLGTDTTLEPPVVDTSPPTVAPTPPATRPQPPSSTPTTTAPPRDTTTTEPAPAPPTIHRFVATISYKPCRGGYLWTLTWATSQADHVEVGPSAGPATTVEPQGTTTVCTATQLGSPTPFTITAHGPGGQISRTVQGESDAPIL